MNYDVVPIELRQRKQWVTWKYVPDPAHPDKPKKMPFNPRTGKAADTTNPETWDEFELAVSAAQKRRHAGVGYVFSDTDPTFGGDLDECIIAGVVAPWAQAIINAMDTYTEISPSGDGVKFFGFGTLPKNFKVFGDKIPKSIKPLDLPGGIELYATARFFTVTARHLPDTPTALREVNGTLDQLVAVLTTDPTSEGTETRTSPRPSATSDEYLRQWAERIIERAEETLQLAPAGSLHDTRIAMARLCGGLIPHGLATSDALAQRLYAARTPSAHHTTERKAIRDGLTMGEKKALELPPPPPQPEFDEEGYAVCPVHHTRLPAAKNGNGYKCHERDTTTANGWCDFWWKGDGYVPPRASDARGTPDSDLNAEPVTHKDDELPLMLPAGELHRIPPAEPLVTNLIYTKKIHQFFGPAGSGKSFLALDIGATIAQHYPVLYIAAEAIEDYPERINAWEAHYGQSAGQLFFWRQPLTLASEQDVQRFIATAQTIKPVVVFIDPLADCMTGLNENDPRDMSIAVYALNTIRRRLGAAVIVIHHTGWTTEHERGHSTLRAACRVVARIEAREDGLIRLTCEKKNHGRKFDPRSFRLVGAGTMGGVVPLPARMVIPGKLRLEEKLLRIMEALTTEPLRKGATHTALLQDTGVPAATLNRSLTALSDAGYVHGEDNGRSRLYYLTEAGKDALDIAFEERSESWNARGRTLEEGGRTWNWEVASSTVLPHTKAVLPNPSKVLPPPPSFPPLGGEEGVEKGAKVLPPQTEPTARGYEPPVYAEATIRGFRPLAVYEAEDGTQTEVDQDLPPEPATAPALPGFQASYVAQMLATMNIPGILTHYRLHRADARGLSNDDVIELAMRESQPETDYSKEEPGA